MSSLGGGGGRAGARQVGRVVKQREVCDAVCATSLYLPTHTSHGIVFISRAALKSRVRRVNYNQLSHLN